MTAIVGAAGAGAKGRPHRAATPVSYGQSCVEYEIVPSVFIGTSGVTVSPGTFESFWITLDGSVAETPPTSLSSRFSLPAPANAFFAPLTPSVLWTITGIFALG